MKAPIPISKEEKKEDIFEMNNQELLRKLVIKVHGSYDTKKEIVNSFLSELGDTSKIGKRKVEIKLDLIANKMDEMQYYKDLDSNI